MATNQADITHVRTPWWRRVTALVSLGSLIVILGIGLAIIAAGLSLGFLYFLERAVG